MARKPDRSAAAKAPTDPGVVEAARRHDAFQARLAAAVMAIAMIAWLGLQWVGSHMGWEARYAFLIDLAAIAAFIWSLAVTWRIWQRRRTA